MALFVAIMVTWAATFILYQGFCKLIRHAVERLLEEETDLAQNARETPRKS